MENRQKEQQCVVGGQNSKGAANIKTRVVARLVPGIEQDPGNQKAGKHEEEVDSKPPWLGCAQKNARPASKVQGAVWPEKSVQKEHAQDGNASQRIQFGHDRTNQLL